MTYRIGGRMTIGDRIPISILNLVTSRSKITICVIDRERNIYGVTFLGISWAGSPYSRITNVQNIFIS